jgi:hypothetical protein
MPSIPASTIRDNLATWAVTPCAVPAVAAMMTKLWNPEPFDPEFYGQYLQTTYFDTESRKLRKARLAGDRYITLRLRAYHPAQGAGGDYPPGRYAVSAKTEDEKDRFDVTTGVAQALLQKDDAFQLMSNILSPSLTARLWEIADEEPLFPVFTVLAHRFATENSEDRLTLDVEVHTDTCKVLEFAVLEFKSTGPQPIPTELAIIPGIRPLKMSKYLWAGEER